MNIQESLKSIYKIQEIDLTKVRAFVNLDKETPSPSPKQNDCQREEEIDLGPLFRLWVRPKFLENPISMVGLPKIVEKILLDHGFHRVKELQDEEPLLLRLTRVLGPSQLEELLQRRSTLFLDRELEREYTIDYGSMMMQLFHPFDRKQLALLWYQRELLQLIPLSSFEKIEVKKLAQDREKRARTQEELRRFFSKETMQNRFLEMMKTLCHPFFVHWIWGRGGFVEGSEIRERFIRKARDEKMAVATFCFFEENGLNRLEESLGLVQERGLFFANSIAKRDFLRRYQAIVPLFSYRGAVYDIEELYRLVYIELSRQGVYFSFEECKKILFSLKEFLLSKDKRGRIVVSMEEYGIAQKNSCDRSHGPDCL